MRFFVFLVFFLISSLCYSDENPIIVTPERGIRNYFSEFSTGTVFTEEDIERSGAQTLVDILRFAPEVSVNSNGPFGKASSIFLRGTNNRHTLILVDGVRVTDVTSISGGARPEFLDLSNVESIEILKGSRGVLYGSEAMGGVIKIKTKSSDKVKTKLRLDLGSFESKGVSLTHQNNQDKWESSTSALYRNVEGVSAFALGSEKDGFENIKLNHSLGRKITDNDRIQLDSSIEISNSEFDDFNGDNFDNKSSYQALRASLIYEKGGGFLWNPKIVASVQEVERDVKTSFNNNISFFDYEASFREVEVNNAFKFNNFSSLIVGLNYELEDVDELDTDIDVNKKRERRAAFANTRVNYNSLTVDFGLRYEDSQFNRGNTLYQFSFSKSYGGFELRGNVGTGFKLPSLYQSFSIYGNDNLLAEKSKSKDLSLLYGLKNINFEVTYFEIQIENLIDYDLLTNQYFNLGELDNRGIEFNLRTSLENFNLGLSGTLSNPVNSQTKEYAVRRPRKRFNASLNYNISDYYFAGISGIYVGERNDNDGSRLPSYLIFNTNLNYRIGDYRTSFFINNLLHKEYQEIRNYTSLGRNILISLSKEW